MAEQKQPANAKVYKAVSLCTLTFQSVVTILLIHYAKSRRGDVFISSTVVVLMETVKFFTCLGILLVQHKFALRLWAKEINDEIIRKPFETLKVAVPAFVYTFQNNLIFVAVANLDAATFQVVSQIKIFTTAVFSMVMLRKHIGMNQWAALVMLFIGIAVVQLDQQSPSHAKQQFHIKSPLLGLSAIIVSSMMSGFAGVYFEKILKGSDVSLWTRNVQLSMYAVPISLLTAFLADGDTIQRKGFLFAYTPVVWTIVCMQAFGGLVIAVVVKYADNILKGFATSFAIIFSAMASVWLFEFEIHLMFIVGAGLVIASIFLYGYVPAKSTAVRMMDSQMELGDGLSASSKPEVKQPLLSAAQQKD